MAEAEPGIGWRSAASADDCGGHHSADALLNQLVRDHGRAVLAVALRSTGNRQSAEEIVQETFIRAWRHPQAFQDPRGSPRGWLLTVARRLVSDRWRAGGRRRLAEMMAAPPEAHSDDGFDQTLEALVIERALARLDQRHREVLVECVWRQRSVREAAAVMGIPIGTVKSRTYYALRSLRLILDEMGYRR